MYYFDFYSLDVEGAELSALRSIDFGRTAFGVLIVERNIDNVVNREVDALLDSNGYNKMHHKKNHGCEGFRNMWYVNKDFDAIYESVKMTRGVSRG